MQAPTHLLFGILIADSAHRIFPNLPVWAQILIIIPLAFISHFFIDATAKFTYHPPKPDWHNKVWISYHLGIYILAFLILIFFWTEYWWVMLFVTLVDTIDWVILRAILKKPPLLHPLADKIRSVLFSKVKDFNHTEWAIISELVVILLLALLIWII